MKEPFWGHISYVTYGVIKSATCVDGAVHQGVRVAHLMGQDERMAKHQGLLLQPEICTAGVLKVFEEKGWLL